MKLIKDNDVIYANIVRANSYLNDTVYFTNETDEIQFGVVNYKKDYKTGAHYHNHLDFESTRVDEIIIVQNGSARIDFYNEVGAYIVSCKVYKGDIAILYQGGHNIIFYEDSKIFRVKSGAYQKDCDETRIISVNNLELKIEND